MPTLHPPAAVLALTELDRELAVDRMAGNLGLILAAGVCFFQVPPPAPRTAVRQRGCVALIDVLRRGNRAVLMTAVPPPPLAPGPFRLNDGTVPCAERRRLPLAGPLRRVQRGGQLVDGRAQTVHRRVQTADLCSQICVLGFQFSKSRVHADAKLATKSRTRQDQFGRRR
jgi:hypothetical protein